MPEQTDVPQMSPQALIVYKAISDQFDFIKKQQWTTTNYVVLIYAAIVWIGQHVEQSGLSRCLLSAGTIVAGLFGAGLLIWFQYDLGELRKQTETANEAFFPTNEKQALGLTPGRHPYLRGCNVLVPLLLVCVIGALLAIFAANWPQRCS
jgi:hypothetical protein